MEHHHILKVWLESLKGARNREHKDHPDYWKDNPKSLISTTSIHSLAFGTGCALYRSSILPAIERAESEVIIVTCFLARSRTLDGLNETLLKLSERAIQNRTRIRVRLCFSSSSLFQKLFHTPSLSGHTYAPAEWHKQLGLPRQTELTGLDLEVKSIFVLPFSVMHPKFVVIDRSRVLLPSCNISWEDWLETSLELSGTVTEHFVNFWKSFWANEGDRIPTDDVSRTGNFAEPDMMCSPRPLALQKLSFFEVPAIFLHSSHHRNPQFTLPFQRCPPPSPTPLNVFLLALFANAQRTIYIQTPNLTSPPVLSALLAALRRGIDVTIVTSERLMILEQLVTAGTTTRRCVRTLQKRHRKLQRLWKDRDVVTVESDASEAPGVLEVKFYQANPDAARDGSEPVQSHLKVTVVDDEWTLFGSGNMDRASWYTSQELGVAFFSTELACEVRSSLRSLMTKRIK